MKLRFNQLTRDRLPEDLPADLTGHAITLDLSHTDARQREAATVLARELLDRGAAQVVISGNIADHAA